MNRLPSLFVFMILMSACTKAVVDVPLHEEEYPIVFDDIRTRSLTTVFNLRDFRVWGETVPGMADVFDGVTVTGMNPDEDGRMHSWTYDDPKYWMSGNVYEFYAVSPTSVDLTYASDDYSFEYSMPENISPDLASDEGHVDIVVAYEKRQTGVLSESPPDVRFEFGHALTKININLFKPAANSSHTMKVQNVYLWGFKGKGTYRFSTGWKCDDEVSAVSVTGLDLELPDNSKPVTVGGILAVPQKLAADQVYLIVEYTYTHGTSTSSNTLATPLPVDIVSEWAAGNAVTYSAEISMEQDIKIDTPKVEPWGTEQVGGTIIIR